MAEDAVRLALLAREREWMDAVRVRDLRTLQSILAPEFTLTTGRAGAEVRARDEYLLITRDRYTIAEYTIEDADVLVYGKAAVVQTRYVQKGEMDGQDRTAAYRMTDVWIWRGGHWQAVARHATEIR
jgi:ketosteroid isomerase-like protein